MLFSKHHTIRFVSVVALLTAGLGSMPTILAEETDVATNKTELDFRVNTVDGNNTVSGEGNMPDLANKPESETNVATNKEQLTGKAIEITVQDEDATPLSSQLVELKPLLMNPLEVAYLIKMERLALLTKSLKVLSMNTMSMERKLERYSQDSLVLPICLQIKL